MMKMYKNWTHWEQRSPDQIIPVIMSCYQGYGKHLWVGFDLAHVNWKTAMSILRSQLIYTFKKSPVIDIEVTDVKVKEES